MRKLEHDQLFALEQSMSETARVLDGQVTSVLSGQGSLDLLARTLRTTQNVTGSRVRILDANRDLILDSLGPSKLQPQDQLRFRPELQEAFTGHYGAYTRVADETPASLALYVAVPVKGPKGPLGAIYVSHTTDQILQQLGSLRRAANRILVFLAGSLFLAALVMTGQLRHTLSRLRELTTFVSTTETEDIPIQGDDRVAEIGENFNRLIASLRSKIAQLEEEKSKTKLFLEDVAHELKTPITGLMGTVEALRGDGLEPQAHSRLLDNLQKESSRLSELTSRLLELQKLDYAEFREEAFDLLSVAETVVDTYQRAAEKKGVNLQVTTEVAAGVLGDPHKIQRVLENLVENAVRCTPGGGTVEVRLEMGDARVTVTVLDDGPGPPEPTAFQRHHQGQTGKGSLGLGLSIASEILKRHQSELAMRAREPKGSEFSFSLRAAGGGKPGSVTMPSGPA